MREFMNGSGGSGNVKLHSALLAGRARLFLQEESDLLALANPVEDDHLSRFLQDNWLFRSRDTSDPYDRTTVYKNAHIVRTVAVLGLLLAAVLLVGAIVTLYLVTKPAAKLGLVAMFTVFFALSVALCTNARRAEVFAATAAYAAVLVVFVSGDLGGTKSEQCLIQLTGGAFKMVDCTSI
ncbi:hypothetical protein E8E13_008990 [Curvularia kusanoi]|uniref:DUF6594 domain-containing protein n=1 Tax=Curvularia kusanoi TaxID=90978 RepID=A0A9P4TE58_CURKU|nr:hypothetical protein E8E13_008990 [Curvularia kusanoi]